MVFSSFLYIFESLRSIKTQNAFCFWALIAALNFSSNPKCRKGNHQTPDSESGPWESHPCRVLRQLRREVSLSLLRFIALSVAVGYFRMVRKRSPPCFPLLPGGAGGSWRTFIRLGLSPPHRNVPDECVFSCQSSLEVFSFLMW